MKTIIYLVSGIFFCSVFTLKAQNSESAFNQTAGLNVDYFMNQVDCYSALSDDLMSLNYDFGATPSIGIMYGVSKNNCDYSLSLNGYSNFDDFSRYNVSADVVYKLISSILDVKAGAELGWFTQSFETNDIKCAVNGFGVSPVVKVEYGFTDQIVLDVHFKCQFAYINSETTNNSVESVASIPGYKGISPSSEMISGVSLKYKF